MPSPASLANLIPITSTPGRAAELGRRGGLARMALLDRPADPAKPKRDPYLEKQLSRIRKQLDRLDAMAMRETDPLKLDRLAAAAWRVSERERKLAGRPDPGHLRPGPPKRSHDPAAGSTCLDGPA